ncbi:MAG: hypothetical protein SH847_19905 [Roseiflexaceae bacterium]|nr:hypothetical protein [Roseiflexaceae bacterium]
MADTAIRANEREAERLFERGVAAARGGQRRVAAGLLSRAVQLNPQHESGWLWLSGTLDDSQAIAFCLRSVLAINPKNERASQGLAWLEQRSRVNTAAAAESSIPTPVSETTTEVPETTSPTATLATVTNANWLRRAADGIKSARPLDAQAVIEHELQARSQGESWWVNFRQTRRDMGRARIFLWSVPILLLALTLALNMVLRSAVARNEQLAREAATAAAIAPIPLTTAPNNQPEVVLSELRPSDDARVLAYLSAIEQPRVRLRAAIDEYRAATNRPGGSSTTHAAAARRLRDTLDGSYTTISALRPPAALTQAHAYYLSGLETEMAALDDMLAFYGSFSVEVANRATVRMSEADRYLERARQGFSQRLNLIAAPSIAQHTMR